MHADVPGLSGYDRANCREDCDSLAPQRQSMVICGQSPSERPSTYMRRIEKVKFGVPVSEAFGHGVIPATLLILLLKLNKEGAYKRDIFRAPGHQGQVRKLIHVMQHGRLVNIANISAHTAASVIKKFLSKLPGGILGRDNEQLLFNSAEIPDEVKQRESVQRVISSLPVPSQHFLVLLFGTFKLISEPDARQTRMNAEAVGVSVAPSLFHTCVLGQRAAMEDLVRFRLASKILTFIVNNFGAVAMLPRDNYEFYARITGRTLQISDDGWCIFYYPPEFGYPSAPLGPSAIGPAGASTQHSTVVPPSGGGSARGPAGGVGSNGDRVHLPLSSLSCSSGNAATASVDFGRGVELVDSGGGSRWGRGGKSFYLSSNNSPRACGGGVSENLCHRATIMGVPIPRTGIAAKGDESRHQPSITAEHHYSIARDHQLMGMRGLELGTTLAEEKAALKAVAEQLDRRIDRHLAYLSSPERVEGVVYRVDADRGDGDDADCSSSGKQRRILLYGHPKQSQAQPSSGGTMEIPQSFLSVDGVLVRSRSSPICPHKIMPDGSLVIEVGTGADGKLGGNNHGKGQTVTVTRRRSKRVSRRAKLFTRHSMVPAMTQQQSQGVVADSQRGVANKENTLPHTQFADNFNDSQRNHQKIGTLHLNSASPPPHFLPNGDRDLSISSHQHLHSRSSSSYSSHQHLVNGGNQAGDSVRGNSGTSSSYGIPPLATTELEMMSSDDDFFNATLTDSVNLAGASSSAGHPCSVVLVLPEQPLGSHGGTESSSFGSSLEDDVGASSDEDTISIDTAELDHCMEPVEEAVVMTNASAADGGFTTRPLSISYSRAWSCEF